jgi:hypothetical protein
MNVDFQAFAFQAMEQKRAMDEELLRLKLEIAQLRGGHHERGDLPVEEVKGWF